MVTTQQRDSTIQAHIQALTALGTSYQREFSSFLNVTKKKDTRSVGDFIFEFLPKINSPFERASRIIGERFLGIRAQQSGAERIPSVLDFPEYSEKMNETVRSNAGLMKSMIIKQRDGWNVTDSDIQKAMEKTVVEADRAVVLTISTNIDDIEDYVVGVRSNGCDFCKSLSARGVTGYGDANFHNNCRCVFDASFKGDPKYKQDFHDEFNERYEEAEKRIENGEIEDRVLSVRSKEWAATNKRAIQQKLRAERKIWEEDYKPSGEQRARARKEDSILTDEIMNRVMEGKTLTSEQVRVLSKGDGSEPFDIDRLFNPIHKPWKTTNADIIKLMQRQKSQEIYGLEKSFK